MAKPAMRDLEVIRTQRVTEHMLRVTLGGENIGSLPEGQESAYIKLVFARGEGERPMMRTYTIRHQRATEIDVDFVLHEEAGPASVWAASARPGDSITIGGPGPRKLINMAADSFLLAGDMTALPAISVNLAELPVDARGHAIIEVPDAADIQTLEHPPGIELHWLINPQPDPEGQPLLEKVASLPRLEGQISVWAACEFGSMRALRAHLKQAYEIPKSHFYVSSYWKIGQSEDGHKLAKQQDAETEQAD
ncbi:MULTISPECIES: siderophore-interacting protein [Cobetia]|uniref:siderophore-interacting protein n=1 Tax=Cobetia TaxID=204286 RepID=UPI0008667139|nr:MULTISPECIES: siderophore-interacting protein [Cobetia]AOM01060.1 NADPH-dependent ferric siderophore reductase [Cobetia marina]AZV31046.1 siderophore-interacting protein [Cobetia sp. ICG0124]